MRTSLAFLIAATFSLGTLAGGMRIMRTLGRRIIHLDPPRGVGTHAFAFFIGTGVSQWRCLRSLPVMSGFCSEPDSANSLEMIDLVRMNHE